MLERLEESTRGIILRLLTDNGLAGQVTDPDFVLRGGEPIP